MDIDKCKENIQPLRGGRNLHQLETALQAQADLDAQQMLQAQKEEHEAVIRNYSGPDPLDPWFNYIQWTEQCFPKHGHEGHIDKLIKECLQIFEKDERYYQDRRFVKLWIKYIDCLTNPLEIYQRLYNSGIGTQCSELYRAWACYCEESGDYKKANQVFVLGLQARAQPFDELDQAHKDFQLFFAQRMLHDDSPTKRKAASALAETRMALTSLKSFKRRNIASVASQRTGDNVRSAVPGTVRQQTGGSQASGPSGNIMVNVFEDVPSTSQAIPAADQGPASLLQSLANVENEKEVGIWSNAKTKAVHSNVVPHQPLPFTPYEDEDLILSANHKAYCLDDLTAYQVRLSVPDPDDPSKICCYNKSMVYADNTEYSLEEIRSRKHMKKRSIEAQDLAQALSTPFTVNVSQEELQVNMSALETLANCALGNEPDLDQLAPLNIPQLQNITRVQNIHSPGEPKILVNLDSKEFSELANPTFRKNDEGEKKNSGYTDDKFVDEFNRSLVRNLHADSITVNTKEARWELRNLFTDNCNTGNNEETIVQPIAREVQKFDICEDRTMTMALNVKNPLPLDELCAPEDKENAQKPFSVPSATQNINKTAYYEEPQCTQVFNFNIKNSSTPNTAQFKKPNSYEALSKTPNVKKIHIEDSTMEVQASVEVSTVKQDAEQQRLKENQENGLSVIMESTRELNSKSSASSGSSGMQSRTTLPGYTTRDSQAHNFDSYQQPEQSKRTPGCIQPRNANGQFAKAYTPKIQPIPEQKVTNSHEHQYGKSYNGYPQQRTQQQYQQAYAYPQNQYSSPQVQHGYQQGYQSPHQQQTQAGYQSPHQTPQAQPGFQSPHHVSQVQPGFQSPHHAQQSQAGFQSPHPVPQAQVAGFQSPPQHYGGYQSPNPVPSSPHYQGAEYSFSQNRQHAYAQPQNFQSPPHQSQYNMQFQRTSNVYGHSGYQQGYTQEPYQNQNSYTNANNYNQNYAQNAYRQPPKQENHYYASANNFQVYQSPNQSVDHNYQTQYPPQTVNASQSPNVAQHKPQPMQTSPSEYLKQEQKRQNTPIQQQSRQLEASHKLTEVSPNSGTGIPQTPAPSHKSPTSLLRSVRHDQQSKPGTPDAGFSNQFLNFITSRNEPKDNANTPKFSNSPNISQKMHKNLYVSSPEQGQMPPSTSDSESKECLTARGTPNVQSAKMIAIEKQKDLSKRQLDFEHRTEYMSEDSRDSYSKEERMSAVQSRNSLQSDGYGMDVDSENSMECTAYKSMHAVSMLETYELARPADIDFPKVIDPFSKKIIESLLEYVKFPNKTHAEGYFEVRSAPKLQTGTTVTVGHLKYSVDKQLGKGNYGAVFSCFDIANGKSVALKYQKPARPWEFYICQEIKARIKDPFMLPGYMDIEAAFLGENASLFASELSKYGSLLDVANKVRVATSKCINELIVLLLTSEMLSIVHYLHKAEIIHADLKPDNFLLMKIPTQEWRTPSLQLIDLGCSIDMAFFPEGTTFREIISTEGFTCTEMREGKPWTYQTDYYCLAGTIHVILMGSYMKVASRVGQWNIDKKLPRYMKVSLWDKIFTSLLNVPDCDNLPDLSDLKQEVDAMLASSGVEDALSSQLRKFANVLKSR